MNTIGKAEDKKLNMSLDEIIAMEPRRYTSTDVQPDASKRGMKIYRQKTFGRNKFEPYEHRTPRNRSRQWAHYTPSPAPSASKDDEECPYMFKYNGVFVTENSPLLSRGTGDIEAIRKRPQTAEGGLDVVVEDDEDDEETKEDTTYNIRTSKQLERKRTGITTRRFRDMTYVRLPVHQRLGFNNNNQFARSKVNLAAKFLRLKKNLPHQITQFKAPAQRQGLGTNNLHNKRLKFQHQKNGQMVKPGSDFMVSFENELATRTQATMLQGGGDVFVAPLSRQNVEQLSGQFTSNAMGSHISSASKSNEDVVLARLLKLENMLSQVAGSGMSMMNGYMPLNNVITGDTSSNISLVNGVPMAKVSSMPMMNSGMTLVNGIPMQKPMSVVVGGEVQSFVPLINSGASTSGQFVTTQQACVQGRVVRRQGEGIVVQTAGPVQNQTRSARIGRQLIIAANRQPLDVSVQNCISATQASVRCTVNMNRVSRESLNYQPTPHITQSSISSRIGCYLPHKPVNYGRRHK